LSEILWNGPECIWTAPYWSWASSYIGWDFYAVLKETDRFTTIVKSMQTISCHLLIGHIAWAIKKLLNLHMDLYRRYMHIVSCWLLCDLCIHDRFYFVQPISLARKVQFATNTLCLSYKTCYFHIYLTPTSAYYFLNSANDHLNYLWKFGIGNPWEIGMTLFWWQAITPPN